jgi:valyl-tRNA synthetase
MLGHPTLWVPGTDHAGIATQNVVERQLLEEQTSKEAIGREAFIQRVWDWKQQSGNTIIGQLKKLGASCDWDRLRFTMDEGLSKAVLEVFIRLHEEGLIYRGERLINWCPRCLTALSDIEVEHEESHGKLYSIHYPLADDPQVFLTIATTRPETLFGDTAVAVHPEDPRYNQFIGKRISLPLTTRSIPIIGDSLLVDREFGTGAVKITPAHDFNDFEAGERHGLQHLKIFDLHAQLDLKGLQEAKVEDSVLQKIQSLPTSKARALVVEELEQRELLVKVEDHKMAIGKCYRCKTIVEPYLSPQWFVKIQPLADPAIEAVTSGKIRIIPEGWTNNYLGWMRDIKDWCISRQIWWGHQIPAWFCRDCVKEEDITATVPDDQWPIPLHAKPIVSRSEPTQCPDCGSQRMIRDRDVLDTWFSSALWPFSTLGWPDSTQDLAKFFPTSTLVTGLDILFFWVARMIMMGLKFTGQPPFRDVYIHALVRDAEGQKMSKSKGNVIDPLTKMSQYGTDALRFTLASMASPGRDIKLAEERIEGYRNFTNKIWNVARFILMYADGPTKEVPVSQRPLGDQWILSRLNHVIAEVNRAFADYRFDQATNALYHFIWHEYCDWYLELIKPALQNSQSPEGPVTRYTLLQSFEILQRLLHPIMPFITEEIWHAIPHEGDSLMVQDFPTSNPDWHSPQSEQTFRLLEQFVATVRTGRSLLEYPPSKSLTLFGMSENPIIEKALGTHIQHLEHLGKGTVHIGTKKDGNSKNILQLVSQETTVGLQVEGEVNLKKAVARIRKQLQTKEKESTRLQARLSSPDFTAKASPEVIQESQTRVELLKQELALLASSESQLNEMMA